MQQVCVLSNIDDFYIIKRGCFLYIYIRAGDSLTAHCTLVHCSLLFRILNSDLFLCKYFFQETKTGKVMD
jgi:hypothetical protein